ncbi:MAG: nicotinamide riboside transporter PnuC [Bacteroidales bacterium]|nr:nicotinamide riboside transporter PnuC [Bacteroidales bacterium]
MGEGNKKVLTWFDWFLIIGVIVSNAIYSAVTKEFDPLGSVASIAGLLCVVLVAKGSIVNYVFGVINVTLYAYISYKARIYGDAGLNLLYYLPMQFVGWWQWRKRGAATSKAEAAKKADMDVQVKARRLNWKQRLLLFVGSAALIALATWILKIVNDPQPLKDGTTTVLSIIAQFLMSLAIMEQWILWIIVDAVSVAMWVILVIRGQAHAGLMVIMWVFYLANAINGLRVWISLSRPVKHSIVYEYRRD